MAVVIERQGDNMKIGGTPTHKFVLPFFVEDINEVEITYQQNEKVILQKHKDDCELDGKTISVTLTQDETFEFSHEEHAEIQLRVLTKGGDVHVSNIIRVDCKRCLSDEVL